MSKFYNALRDKAEKVIGKYGSEATYVKPDAEGNITSIETTLGVMGVIRVENMPSSLNGVATAYLNVAVGHYKPSVDDYIRFGGVTYKILYVDETNPSGGEPVIYGLYLSK